MSNLLDIAPDYQITHTPNGVWRRYLYSSGAAYSEYTSRRSLRGWPLVQIANGRSPETGKMAVARGVIAIGQRARGALAIGQMAHGVVAIGQLATGIVAVGQVAAGVLVGVGQIATGVVAVGQIAVGVFGWGQQGIWPATLWTHRLHFP